MVPRRLIFRDHATQRMMQRGVRVADIRWVSEHGEVIEDYPNDYLLPSRLLLAWIRGKPLHIVAADHITLQVTFIITVYEPNPDQWEPDFKRRRHE
jgi:hypothetical protein